MQIDTSTLVIYILLAIVVLLAISYFLFRWIFSMKRQLWNQRQQITLLIKIAEKIGVPRSEVEVIEERNKSKEDQFLD
jgi:hypothetical protein